MASTSPRSSAEPATVPKRRAPILTLTTAGKIAKAQAREKREAAARKQATSTKSKPRSLPPPAEYAAQNKLEEAAKKLSSRKRTPLTNKEKMLAATAAAKAKEKAKARAEMKAKMASSKVKESGTKRKAVQSEVGMASMMSELHGHGASAIKYEDTTSARKATKYHRRTQRSEKFVRERREAALADPGVKLLWEDKFVQAVLAEAKKGDAGVLEAAIESAEMGDKFVKLISAGLVQMPYPKPDKAFRLMDLPAETRDMVWKLVVVDKHFFIWPNSATGREQPDLAMVNSQIRREVLPIFYGENTFAVDLSPSNMPQAKGNMPKAKGNMPKAKKGSKAPSTGLVAVKEWAEKLAVSGTFQHIRKWAFEYASKVAWTTGGRDALDNDQEDDSFLISLKLQKPLKQHRSWRAEVEIHREAHCVLSTDALCAVKATPAWLNDAIFEMLDKAADHKGVGPESIVSLAKTVMKNLPELAESRCEDVEVKNSIERDSAFGGD